MSGNVTVYTRYWDSEAERWRWEPGEVDLDSFNESLGFDDAYFEAKEEERRAQEEETS